MQKLTSKRRLKLHEQGELGATEFQAVCCQPDCCPDYCQPDCCAALVPCFCIDGSERCADNRYEPNTSSGMLLADPAKNQTSRMAVEADACLGRLRQSLPEGTTMKLVDRKYSIKIPAQSKPADRQTELSKSSRHNDGLVTGFNSFVNTCAHPQGAQHHNSRLITGTNCVLHFYADASGGEPILSLEFPPHQTTSYLVNGLFLHLTQHQLVSKYTYLWGHCTGT